MTPICDLRLGAVSVTQSVIECNGGDLYDFTPLLLVNGAASSASGFTITNSDIHVILSNASSPTTELSVSHSSVTITLDGSNSFRRVDCADSNITFQAMGDGSINADAGGVSGAGIGTAAGGVCGSLLFMNGSIRAHGGTRSAAIGTGEIASGASPSEAS
jgi:hypothetical protein